MLLNFTGEIFIRHYSWICRLHLTFPLIALGGRTGPLIKYLGRFRPALIRGFLIDMEPPVLWLGTSPL